MISPSTSLLLSAFEQAKTRLKEHAPLPSISALLEELDAGDRGSLRSWSEAQPPTPAPTLTATQTHLATISAELAQVQAWLTANPDLLQVLDASIRDQVKQMERRTNRTALQLNVLFTVVGALLGLALPPLVSWIASLLGL